MDPNKLGQLDPKLKEAYDRVMNAATPPPPPPPPYSQTPQTAQTSPSQGVNPPPPPPPPLSSPQTAKEESSSPPPPPHLSMPAKEVPPLVNTPPPDISTKGFTPMNASVSVSSSNTIASKFPAYKAGTLKAHKGGNVPTVLWILLAAVFFIAYTLIWVRVLGVSLPFL